MTHPSLLTLSLVLCSLNQAASEVCYITTNSTDLECTVQPCLLTLSQFAANLSCSLHSNTTLVFLPGTHHLSNVNLNVDNFVMKSENSTAQIKCTSDSSMQFYQSQSIYIFNLEFIGCGRNQVRHVEELMFEDTKFEGQENNGTVLELIETTAQIVNSTFLSNKGSFRECPLFDPEQGCAPDGFIGGAIIVTNSTVEINQSTFEDNGADLGGAIFAEQDSIINMSDNEFVSNNADMFGGVLASDSSTITIEGSKFHYNSASDEGGGGVLISNNSTITIEGSKFHYNSASDEGGGGVLISNNSTITIEGNGFHGNNANNGGVLYSINSTITIEASGFHDNYARDAGGVLVSDDSTITIEGSGFHDNYARKTGGVLISANSTITIEGSGFHGNNATNGGVLYSINSTK